MAVLFFGWEGFLYPCWVFVVFSNALVILGGGVWYNSFFFIFGLMNFTASYLNPFSFLQTKKTPRIFSCLSCDDDRLCLFG